MSVVGIGLISQVPHRSEADFRESCQGQDVILISSLSLSTVWNSSKTLFISTAFVNSVCELKTCNILLPPKCSVVDYMISPIYVWFTYIRSSKNVVNQRPTGVSDSLPT